MSAEDKPDMARSWQALQKLIAEDDAKWLETASDEEVEQRMNADGVKLSGPTSADEILTRMKALEASAGRGTGHGGGDAGGAKVRRLPFARKVGPWIFGLVVAGGGGAVVAANSVEMLSAKPPPHSDAAKLREEAFAACDAAKWADCARKLDDAKEVDPDGERDERVVRAREAIAKAGGGQKANPR